MIVRLTGVDGKLRDANRRADEIMSDPDFTLNDLDKIDEVYDRVFTPSEESRPMSKWTKKAIIDCAVKGGIPESHIDVLRRMTLDDLRIFLKEDGNYLCGRSTNFHQCRHVTYYVLDLRFMMVFLEV